jgi:peptide/nickel transport system substrate-binding protein
MLALALAWLAAPAGPHAAPAAPTARLVRRTTPAQQARSARQALSGGGTLTVLEPGAPDTLDPLLTRTAAGADATAGVFDALVRIDATGIPRPDLAARWTHSVDARTWTFYLDHRARWHDGEPVTADDVAFTARLVRDARFGATTTRGFDHIASLVVGGSDVLTVTLRASFAPFLATFGTTPILPEHVLGAIAPERLRDYAPLSRHPIGSGPFVVAQFTADGRVVEDATADYFGGAPHLDRLVIAPARSRQAALAAARADGSTLLPPALGLSPAEAAQLGSTPATGAPPRRARSVGARLVPGRLVGSAHAWPAATERAHARPQASWRAHASGPARAVYTPSFAWTHLDLIEHGALADPLVRRALAFATPRERIIAQVLRGHGRLCDGDQAPGTPAYEPALRHAYRYNLRAARRLLAQAGFRRLKEGLLGRGGAPLSINLWGDASCGTCTATLRLIAQGWRAAGVASHLRLVPTTTLFGPRGPLYSPGRFRSSQYDAVLYAWVNGPDPDDSAYWTRAAIVSPAHPLGGNFDGYANAAVDALVTRALATPNGPARDAFYRRIQRVLAADEPDIFLYWADTISVVPRRLRGYDPTPYESAATWNAREWRVTK